MVLKELIFIICYFARVAWSRYLTFNTFFFGRGGGLEKTDFKLFLLWYGVVVWKELIFNSFYCRRV